MTLMTTFVHLDLQNHINNIFHELPDENIQVEDINTLYERWFIRFIWLINTI